MIFKSHMKSMIQKRIWCFKKDIKAILSEILLPILFIILGLGIASITIYTDQPMITYS